MRTVALRAARLRRRARSACVVVLTCSVLGMPSGCGSRRTTPRSALAPARLARPNASVVAADAADGRPLTVTFRDVPAPELAFREYSLPVGCAVTDANERWAVYVRTTFAAYPGAVFGLLDLKTGRRHEILSSPVGSARRFSAFAPRISEDWIVWEEVSPDESAAPRNAEWRLYAAPLDTSRQAIGPPQLIDEGTTDFKLRPMYDVVGSTVCWTVNTVPSARQEYVSRSGTVAAVDLDSGARRTLFESSRSVPTLRADESRIVVTEVASGTASPYRQSTHVVDVASGRLLGYLDLGNRFSLSHTVDFSAGRFAWASFLQDGAQWPAVHIRDARGTVALAAVDAMDPAFFGDYVAFESIATSLAGGSVTRTARQIWLANPDADTRALLLETSDASGTGGWWQIAASSGPPETLVLWNDLGPWTEDQSEARTLVRVYDARAP